MKGLFLILILLLIPIAGEAACTGSSPTWTSTPDYASVNTCVSSAGRGDTINVTAGSATWSSALALTKGVSLIGAGRDSVTIIASGSIRFINVSPDSTAISNDEMIKITGFTFDGNGSVQQFIYINGAGASSAVPFRKLVIGDNRFKNMSTASGSVGVIYNRGQTRGIIYNNIFDRVNEVFDFEGNNDITEWTNGHFPFTYGSSDNLYFEDNTITFSSPQGGVDQGMYYAGQGARVVVRYNTWNWTGQSTMTEGGDHHGFQNYPGNGQDGTMIAEYYGNTLINATGYRWLNHRGSWGMIFNNSTTGTGAMSIQENQYGPGDIGGSGCNTDDGLAALGINGQINNTYTFNNLLNGSAVSMVSGGTSGCGITKNIDYFNYDPSCTASACSAGIGRGTTAPSGTCTTGVGYWVSSTPAPTTSASVIQNSTFYKCISTNTWVPYYTPYAYPHPLRSGDTSARPNPPRSLSVS